MNPPPDLPDLDCVCATIRRASRLVTQLYDEELREHIPAAQFTLLSVLEARPGLNQAVIANALGFDKTTLSRNLNVLEKNGWIEPAVATNRRDRGYVLTNAGRKLLAAAKPAWRRAQQRLRSALSASEWTTARESLRVVTNAVNRSKSH